MCFDSVGIFPMSLPMACKRYNLIHGQPLFGVKTKLTNAQLFLSYHIVDRRPFVLSSFAFLKRMRISCLELLDMRSPCWI